MTGHLTPLGSSTHTTVARGVLPVGFSKYDNSSFKLRTGPLPPGEYAVSCVRRQTAFCFGVDPQKIPSAGGSTHRRALHPKTLAPLSVFD